MIAIRSLTGTTSSHKPRASRNRAGQPTGDLVRGYKSLHGAVRDLGSTVVGRRASGESLVATVHAESPVGPSSVVASSFGAEPDSERDCGA